MRTTILFFTLLTLSLLSCKDKKTTADSDRISTESTTVPYEVINYRKTPCFGVCPTFEMTVMSDGKATYSGERNVEMEGRWTAQWTADQLDQIVDKANEIGYFEMENEYDNKMVTDLPATYTTIHNGDSAKTVMNRYRGPEALQELYGSLDELIEKIDWNKINQN